MKAILAVAVVLGVVLAGSALTGSDTPVAQAAPVTIDLNLTGAENVPPVNEGSAFARFTFDDQTNVMTYAVTVKGMSSGLITASHIHLGAAGTNGPIVYPLSTTGFSIVTGSITLTSEDVANLKAGLWYVNVHSVANPSGFARAQILLPKPTSAVTPPSTGDAGLAGGSAASLMPLAGLVLAFGAGSLALARRRA